MATLMAYVLKLRLKQKIFLYRYRVNMHNPTFWPLDPNSYRISSLTIADNHKRVELSLTIYNQSPDELNRLKEEIISDIKISEITRIAISIEQSGQAFIDFLKTLLANNTYIEQLDLTSASFNSEGCAALGALLATNLTIEKIIWCSEKFAAPQLIFVGISQNQYLKTLEFWNENNKISIEDAKGMSGALATNQSLTHLDFTVNNISDDCFNALSTGLKSNSTLISINFGGYALNQEKNLRLLASILEHSYISQIYDVFSSPPYTPEQKPTNIISSITDKSWKEKINTLLTQNVDKKQKRYKNTHAALSIFLPTPMANIVIDYMEPTIKIPPAQSNCCSRCALQ